MSTEGEAMSSKGTVYLIHFDRPIGNPNNPRGQAQHYLGWTGNLTERMLAHVKGQGAAIMAFLSESKIGWQVVKTWKGGRHLERQLKNRKQASFFCPVCQRKKQDEDHRIHNSVSEPSGL